MAVEDVIVQNMFVFKCGSALAAIGIIWYFRKTINHYTHQKLFAYFMNRYTEKMNKGLRQEKLSVFDRIHKHTHNTNGELTVLEVGAGTAANLEFLPVDCKLTCLDPNPHFEGYIKQNLEKTDTVVTAEIIRGYAEDIPSKDNIYDVVVCTLVLCSVSCVKKSLEEIKRVLKPVSMSIFK